MRVRADGAIGRHAVATELGGLHQRQRRDPGFRCRVRGLADTPEQARSAARVHDASRDGSPGLRAIAPVRGGMSARSKMTLEVYPHHRVPLVLFCIGEHPVANEAGVVHDDVQITELVESSANEASGTVPVSDVVTVCDRDAARGADLVDDLLSRAAARARPVELDAEVVDDDLRALRAERERMRATEPPRSAGDDDDTVVADPHRPGTVPA
jgi:hypothetical protein